MKKLMMMVAVVMAFAFAGCKTVPTADKMHTAAQAVGYASGMVANETKIDDKSRDVVIEVVAIVKEVTPDEGQSFRDAWTNVAREYTADLVRAGKLDEAQAALVTGGVSIAGAGLDYVFATYPKAKSYEELVAAAVTGFCDGFLTTFRPVNMATRSAKPVDYDRDAYLYLKTTFETK